MAHVWSDLEYKKLMDRLTRLEAQVRRTAREADARSTGAKFTIREPSTQIDGNVNIDGNLDVGGDVGMDPGQQIEWDWGSGSDVEIHAYVPPATTWQQLDIQIQNLRTNEDARMYIAAETFDPAHSAIVELRAGYNLADAVWLHLGAATPFKLGTSELALTVPLSLNGDQVGVSADWTPAVDQGGAVTVTVNAAKYIMVGNLVILLANLAVTGSGTGGNAIIVSGWDSAINPLAGWNGVPVGTCRITDTGTTDYWGVCYHSSTTALRFIDSVTQGQIGANPSFALANGDFIRFSMLYTR